MEKCRVCATFFCLFGNFTYLCTIIDLEPMLHYTIYNSLIFTTSNIPTGSYCLGGLVPSYLFFSCPHMLHPAAGGLFFDGEDFRM